MTDIPKRLFHITDRDNVEAILLEGFRATFGNYFSSTIDNASRFMALRAMTRPGASWVAIEIETDGLDVQPGGDHSPAFFGTDDSWVVDAIVPPWHIVNLYEVTFGQDTLEDA